MIRLFKLSLLLLPLLIIASCSECEDKTLVVSDALLEFLPYQDTTNVIMVNDANETKSITINPSVLTSTRDDRDCTTSIVKPRISLDSETQDEFLTVWVSYNEDILGDNEQVWFILDDEDGSIFSSGRIRDPLFQVNTVVLNGVSFDEVISVVIGNDDNTQNSIHLQRNVGLIAYEQADELWVVQ